MLRIIEKPDLPKEIFKVEVKPQLLAQAVRVYLANQRQGTQSTLSRAEVNRTGRKIWKQKGTGRARHGSRKAPIFVGGGLAHGPKPRDYSLALSDRMRTLARLGALSTKVSQKKTLVVNGLDELVGKTKELAEFLNRIDSNAKSWLIVTDDYRENILRAGRNLPDVEITPTSLLNTYQILKADKVLIMEEVIKKIKTAKVEKQKTSRRTSTIKKATTKKTSTKPKIKPRLKKK